MDESTNPQPELAPSELRSFTEFAGLLGVSIAIAAAAGALGGQAGETMGGMFLFGAGILLSAKGKLETYHRETRPAETNAEFMRGIAEAIRGLRRKDSGAAVPVSTEQVPQ